MKLLSYNTVNVLIFYMDTIITTYKDCCKIYNA